MMFWDNVDIEPFVTNESERKIAENLLTALKKMDASYHRAETLRGLRKARRAGRVGGCPSKLSKEQQQELKEMVAVATVKEISEHFHISRATVYAYIKRVSRPKVC